MKALLLITSLATAALAHGQVRIDRPLELTGDDPADRQVIGVRAAAAPGDALDAATLQSGSAHLAGDAATASWQLQLPALDQAPTAGTALIVRIAAAQSGTAQLSVNGFGPYPVERAPGEPLLVDGIAVGSLLSVVFDGTAFQVTNGAEHARRPCPQGLVQVTDQFCMQPQESAAIGFFEGALACAQAGLRLCTWGEFNHACQNRVALGLTQMVNNWEWTNDTSNEDQSVRVVGNGYCTASANRLTDSALITYSRCCFTR